MATLPYRFFSPRRPLAFCLFLLFAGVGMLLPGCQENEFPAEKALFEVLDSARTQIYFVNKIQDQPNLNILDYLYFYNGAGVAAGDVNKDGRPDLFFVSNQGKNRFVRVT